MQVDIFMLNHNIEICSLVGGTTIMFRSQVKGDDNKWMIYSNIRRKPASHANLAAAILFPSLIL